MGFEGYDDWKTTEPESGEWVWFCDECGHPEGWCDCFCCFEPEEE